MSISKIGLPVIGVLLIGAAIMFWSSRGYGKVSSEAYEVSKALYGACLAKDGDRLNAVEALLDEDAENSLTVSDTERRWLESMINTARDGDWKSAADASRRMMEDQVEY